MDDKELIRRIKNSLANGKSNEEITKNLLERGYRLEYINILLNKAKSRKLIYFLTIPLLLIFIFMVFFSGFLTYSLFFAGSSLEKINITNPLQDLDIIFELDLKESPDKSLDDESPDTDKTKTQNHSEKSLHIDDIKITPDFITYLLNELGAWKLKRNPITREKPVIDFKINEKEFSSVIEKGIIKTTKGFSTKPDIVFYSNKKDIIKAIISEEPAEIFKKSYSRGDSTFEIKKSEADLFAKGYLTLYNALDS